jgi:hypothetical protein
MRDGVRNWVRLTIYTLNNGMTGQRIKDKGKRRKVKDKISYWGVKVLQCCYIEG